MDVNKMLSQILEQLCCIWKIINSGAVIIFGSSFTGEGTVESPKEINIAATGAGYGGGVGTEDDPLIINGGGSSILYEEGVWTPSGSDPIWNVLSGQSICRYTRIGSIVTTSCRINIQRASGGPGGNSFPISGLFVPSGFITSAMSIERWKVSDNSAGFNGIYDLTIDSFSSAPVINLWSSSFQTGSTGDIIAVEFTATYIIESQP